MILGTTEVEGEARVYANDSINPGQSGIIFFKPYEPVLAFIGDRFVMRLPTPGVTVGGGTVLDIAERFPRKKEWPKYEYLRQRINPGAEVLVRTQLIKSGSFSRQSDFMFCNYSGQEINDVIDAMAKESTIVEHGGRYYPAGEIEEISATITGAMKKYFEREPHIDGLPIDSIVRMTGLRENTLAPILQLMCDRRILVKKGNRFDLAGREVIIKGELSEIAGKLEDKFREGNFMPPGVSDVVGDDKTKKEAFDYLILSGKLKKVSGGIVFHRDAWEDMLKTLRTMLNNDEKLTVAAFREKIGTTRKFALPVLEETDRLKITERRGDIRIKGEKFEKV
jgi:selenocysteine-specific elongation factor